MVKRHHFGGGFRTHGQSDRERAPGSIGSSSYPSRVFKGMRMAGRMGGEQVTVRNLKVVGVIPDSNLLLVKGSVPGAINGFLEIHKTTQRNEARGAIMELEVYRKDGTEERREGEALRRDLRHRAEPGRHVPGGPASIWTTSARERRDVKTRSEVRGGGKKPFKQKHTGMARQGSSPLAA